MSARRNVCRQDLAPAALAAAMPRTEKTVAKRRRMLDVSSSGLSLSALVEVLRSLCRDENALELINSGRKAFRTAYSGFWDDIKVVRDVGGFQWEYVSFA